MRRLFLILSFLFLSLFGLFTFIVRKHVLDKFDFDTTVRLQNHTPHSLDTVYSLLSLMGSAEVMTLLLVVTLIHYKWRMIPIGIAYIVGLGIELFGKVYLPHPGPPFLFFRYDLGFSFPSSYVHTAHSYPSGHAFRTTFVAFIWLVAFFGVTRRRTARSFFLLLVILGVTVMMLSRVVLGEHWTTDVIGGAFLGLGLGCVSGIFGKRKKHYGETVSKKGGNST